MLITLIEQRYQKVAGMCKLQCCLTFERIHSLPLYEQLCINDYTRLFGNDSAIPVVIQPNFYLDSRRKLSKMTTYTKLPTFACEPY
jgi:hypothetical protein